MIEKSGIAILYGSQTGNSEHIAKDVHAKFVEAGIESSCQPLNTAKKVALKDTVNAVLIVCSTTGNGDCPENADQWWRSVKIRSAAKDTFESLPYAVLGLGDTNYDKFCYMGKSIDKRLHELGGKRLLDVCCADEATGLEEVVEKWKIDIMNLVKGLYSCQSNSMGKKSDNNYPSDEVKAIEPTTNLESNACEDFVQATLPVDIMGFREMSEWLGVHEQIKSQPSSSDLPRSKALPGTISIPSSPRADHKKSEMFSKEWNVEHPYLSSVVSASYVSCANDSTVWEDVRKVIKVELSLHNSDFIYEPGDTIGVCCPNPDFHVDVVHRRLQKYYSSESISLKSDVYDAVSNNYCSLEELLRFRYDLTGPPKKAAVFCLSKFCTDPDQSNFMQWLCSKSAVGKQLWKYFVEDQRIGIAELLELVPTCCPTIDALVSCLIPMPPRFYSIASSSLAHNNSLVFAFSVVRYACKLEHPINKQCKVLHRHGVCTSFLEKVLNPWLSTTTANPVLSEPVQLRIFHKSNVNFHLPGSSALPLILIGPGTGVAPFIGFLEHIERCGQERARSGDDISTGVWRGGFEVDNLPCECGYLGQFINAADRGPVYLFFGCRNTNDYLFKSYLEEKASDGVLTCLDVAMSRAGAEKVYVTHKVEARGAELCDLILNKSASIYICGDGNSMAKSVYESMKKIFVQHAGLSEVEASETLEDLKHRRRYLQDIWS